MIVESDRKVRETNFGSFMITVDKKWIKANDIKAGEKLKQLSMDSVAIIIAPNSPLHDPENLKKFKEDMKEW